ncbi:MAG: rRNA maturation RNase YbeY [Halioglobus sp.]
MILTVDIQSASVEPVPEEDDIRGWLAAALDGRCPQARCEVSVRLVDREEMTTLNTTYRGKPGATNVLSFPADLPAVNNDDLPGDGLLGDIVICAPVVREEASNQGKSTQAHWAHMTVHGALHLLGYDHIDDQDAEVMEALETAILGQLKYPCPYRETLDGEHTKP